MPPYAQTRKDTNTNHAKTLTHHHTIGHPKTHLTFLDIRSKATTPTFFVVNMFLPNERPTSPDRPNTTAK